jgi:hypothetical protein
MTTPLDAAHTSLRWYVRTAGYRDPHCGALATDGRVVALRGCVSLRNPTRSSPGHCGCGHRPTRAVLPHLPDHRHPPAHHGCG